MLNILSFIIIFITFTLNKLYVQSCGDNWYNVCVCVFVQGSIAY